MFLLFDIGGTKTRIAVSDGNTVGEPKIIPTPADFQQGLQAIKTIAAELSGGQKIEGVAGGIAGPLDKDKTMLVKSPHVGGWINQPFKQELQKLFGDNVHLENDADLGGLGEATKGAGINHKIVAYFTVSTGVGGVRIIEGKIDHNSMGFEPGHQVILPEGNQCECGGKGHLEAYVGGLYFPRIYQQKGEEITDPKIWDEISKYLAIGLNNSIVHWSPDIFILGGSVSKSLPLDRVEFYLKQNLTIFPEPPPLIKGTLGDSAGLYGALALLSK